MKINKKQLEVLIKEMIKEANSLSSGNVFGNATLAVGADTETHNNKTLWKDEPNKKIKTSSPKLHKNKL